MAVEGTDNLFGQLHWQVSFIRQGWAARIIEQHRVVLEEPGTILLPILLTGEIRMG